LSDHKSSAIRQQEHKHKNKQQQQQQVIEPPTPNDVQKQKHHFIELLFLFTQNQVSLCSLRFQLMQAIAGTLAVDIYEGAIPRSRDVGLHHVTPNVQTV